jgi:hypothetical protein
VGRLDPFSLADVLQILSSADKTGTLTLNLRFDQGLIVLRRGKIIYAASTSSRQTLGSVLVSRGLIDEEALSRSMEELLDASRELRLGTVLVENGLLDEDVLGEVLKNQVRLVLAEFMRWKGAYFRFEPLRIPDHGEIEVDAKDFLLEQGLSTDELLLDLFSEEGAETERPVASLWSIMSEIQPPEFTGEITPRILESSRRHLARGALFGVYHDGFRRMSQFSAAGVRAESLHLPAADDCLLCRVVDSRRPYRGAALDTEVDRLLMEEIGGGTPDEVVAIPMLVRGRVVAVLYGDGGPEAEKLGETEQLEVELAEISLGIERAALDKRLRHVSQLRGRSEG